ncbi:MAG: hypothetical protein KDB27_30555 [Planctomycetales bacterium]|nr:hypothetical protein [Planctomycetales bacterium]
MPLTSKRQTLASEPRRNQKTLARQQHSLHLESLETRSLLASSAELLMDVNTTPPSSGIDEAVIIGSTVFFRAGDAEHGSELWKTDGTAAGTVLVKDIAPGAASSSPTSLTAVRNTLFFVSGIDLWKSNGTEASTQLVKQGVFPRNLAAVNGSLFFSGWSNDLLQQELFVSDGSEVGTVVVKDINPAAGSYPDQLTNVNGKLFFTTFDSSSAANTQLWTSDGTSAGTVLLKDESGSGQSFGELTRVGNTLFYRVNSDLWKSSGTAAGTVLVKDAVFPSQLTDLNGTLIFRGHSEATGYELFKSDGTNAGTVVVKDLRGGSNGSVYSTQFTKVGGEIFFTAFGASSTGYDYDLFKTDGTAQGTLLVKDLNVPNGPHVSNQFGVGNRLFFALNDPVTGNELWTSNGTSSGTSLVKDISPNELSSNPDRFVALGDKLVFTAENKTNGRELWTSDGTTSGTILVKDIDSRTYSGFASDFTKVGKDVFFRADSTSGSGQIWKTNGTRAGTSLVKSAIYPSSLVEFKGQLLFQGWSPDTGYDLFRSDGTEAGTVLVKDIDTGFPQIAEPTVVGESLFFVATDNAAGRELWKTDGTAAGTVLVKNIFTDSAYGFPNSSNPENLTAVGNTLFFTANNGTSGRELWKSDGTAAGTVLVKDIWPDSTDGIPNNASPSELTNFNGTLLFVASGNGDRELWKSDGTSAGTVRVKDVNVMGSSYPIGLTVSQNRVFFHADDGVNGRWLWKTDGTPAGTNIAVMDYQFIGFGDHQMTDVNGTLFFEGNRGYSNFDGVPEGWELWKVVGSTVTQVKDINPGFADAYVRNFTAVANELYFTATDGQRGIELWKSDGTEAGTVLVKDVFPGSSPIDAPYGRSSYPDQLYNAGGQLFFTADDGQTGREPWVIVPSASIVGSTNSPSETGGSFTVTATLTSIAVADVIVNLSYAGSATGGGFDYSAPSTIVIPAGQLSAAVPVTIVNDNLVELNEQIVINTGTVVGANKAGVQSLTTTIVNDDSATFSIDDISVPEGSGGGASNVVFTVTLSAAVDTGMSLSFNTSDGTATTGDNDFVSTSGVLNFIGTAGETRTISVPVTRDNLFEPNETFLVQLSDVQSNGRAVSFAKSQGTSTIVNDDSRPGDFNNDSVVNVADIDLLCAGIRGHDLRFDLTSDGNVGQPDLQFMIKSILKTSFGDANLDGKFNSTDLIRIFQAGEYEDGIPGNSTWVEGDWNCDGDFNTTDLIVAFVDAGYQTSAHIQATDAAIEELTARPVVDRTFGAAAGLTPERDIALRKGTKNAASEASRGR